MSHSDDLITKSIFAVIGILVFFAIVVGFLASNIGGGHTGMGQKDISARITPVGKVRVPGDEAVSMAPAVVVSSGDSAEKAAPAPAAESSPAEAAEAAAVEEVAAAAPASGKDTYMATCFACHGTGAAGAPKVGDNADWAARAGQGRDMLVEHAIKGYQGNKGYMPAKGGNASLSDDAIAAAIDHMLSESGV